MVVASVSAPFKIAHLTRCQSETLLLKQKKGATNTPHDHMNVEAATVAEPVPSNSVNLRRAIYSFARKKLAERKSCHSGPLHAVAKMRHAFQAIYHSTRSVMRAQSVISVWQKATREKRSPLEIELPSPCGAPYTKLETLLRTLGNLKVPSHIDFHITEKIRTYCADCLAYLSRLRGRCNEHDDGYRALREAFQENASLALKLLELLGGDTSRIIQLLRLAGVSNNREVVEAEQGVTFQRLRDVKLMIGRLEFSVKGKLEQSSSRSKQVRPRSSGCYSASRIAPINGSPRRLRPKSACNLGRWAMRDGAIGVVKAPHGNNTLSGCYTSKSGVRDEFTSIVPLSEPQKFQVPLQQLEALPVLEHPARPYSAWKKAPRTPSSRCTSASTAAPTANSGDDDSLSSLIATVRSDSSSSSSTSATSAIGRTNFLDTRHMSSSASNDYLHASLSPGSDSYLKQMLMSNSNGCSDEPKPTVEESCASTTTPSEVECAELQDIDDSINDGSISLESKRSAEKSNEGSNPRCTTPARSHVDSYSSSIKRTSVKGSLPLAPSIAAAAAAKQGSRRRYQTLPADVASTCQASAVATPGARSSKRHSTVLGRGSAEANDFPTSGKVGGRLRRLPPLPSRQSNGVAAAAEGRHCKNSSLASNAALRSTALHWRP